MNYQDAKLTFFEILVVWTVVGIILFLATEHTEKKAEQELKSTKQTQINP